MQLNNSNSIINDSREMIAQSMSVHALRTKQKGLSLKKLIYIAANKSTAAMVQFKLANFAMRDTIKKESKYNQGKTLWGFYRNNLAIHIKEYLIKK